LEWTQKVLNLLILSADNAKSFTYLFLAVRPDRDAAGRTHPIRHKRIRNTPGELAVVDEEEAEGGGGGMITDDWIRKMPVEMRTLLMQLLNVDLMVYIFLKYINSVF
jgi:hypothetical protein